MTAYAAAPTAIVSGVAHSAFFLSRRDFIQVTAVRATSLLNARQMRCFAMTASRIIVIADRVAIFGAASILLSFIILGCVTIATTRLNQTSRNSRKVTKVTTFAWRIARDLHWQSRCRIHSKGDTIYLPWLPHPIHCHCRPFRSFQMQMRHVCLVHPTGARWTL